MSYGDKFDLAQGEEACIAIDVKREFLRRLALRLEAGCGCGGRMIPKPGKELEWICNRSQWWRFWSRKHAHLRAEILPIPPPGGSA